MTTPESKPLALVTGASSGIGLELARQVGENGIDLVISAAAPLRPGSSAAITRSNPFWPNWRASSSPIPLDAPVTRASSAMSHPLPVGVIAFPYHAHLGR